jgi:hypothetical protein
MNLTSLINAFKPSTKSVTNFDENSDVIIKKVVSHLSEGSISLQSSHYMTKSDIDNRASKVFKHTFCQ